VKEKKTKSTQDCQFPFKLGGNTYTNCTTIKDPEKKPWCSTKVSKSGFHIGGEGFWGYCDIVGGECLDGKSKDEILLAIVNAVQETQQIGLEKQKNANGLLAGVLDTLNNPEAGKCETKVLLEELKNIRKDQEDAFQLQTEAYEVLQKVLDQLPNKNDVQ